MPFIRPSTRSFFKAFKQKPGFSLSDRLHGYIYMRFPYLYIGIGTGEHKLAPLASLVMRIFSRFSPGDAGGITFADTYHGKTVPLETARTLVSVKEEINTSYPEKVIPYKLARDLILEDQGHIVALDCPCRAARPNPCLPLDVCIIVGEPFASLVLEHHPARSRSISCAEAIDILEAEDLRGHVHHAFFKQAMVGRFYAICNCCTCCCGAMQAHKNGVPMLAQSGYLSRIDKDVCIECGDCQKICPFEAIHWENGTFLVDENLCMGCGVCRSHCQQEAIVLVETVGGLEPLQVPI